MASLRGRYVIDCIKKLVEPRFLLPVPPYGKPEFWDEIYSRMGPTDVFEWGNCSFSDLVKYDYKLLDHPLTTSGIRKERHNDNEASEKKSRNSLTTTLEETLIPPDELFAGESENNDVNEKAILKSQKRQQQQRQPILMLGCGNSRFGEDMVEFGGIWKHDRLVLVQVDVSMRVIEGVSQRCKHEIERGNIAFVQDDATRLSSLSNAKIQAISAFDKGLMDALFCAAEYDQIRNMVRSVHHILRPGGIFCFLSFSRPEFLLDKLQASVSPHHPTETNLLSMWQNIQIRELDQILLYRLQKPTNDSIGGTSVKQPNKKIKRRN